MNLLFKVVEDILRYILSYRKYLILIKSKKRKSVRDLKKLISTIVYA